MDIAVANKFLASFFGPDRSTVAPDSWSVALFVGDPTDDGTEQDGPGYARVTLSSDDFPSLAEMLAGDNDGTTQALVQFGAATGEWPDDSTHWALFDGTDLGPSGELSLPVEVAGAGSFDPVLVELKFNDVSEAP